MGDRFLISWVEWTSLRWEGHIAMLRVTYQQVGVKLAFLVEAMRTFVQNPLLLLVLGRLSLVLSLLISLSFSPPHLPLNELTIIIVIHYVVFLELVIFLSQPHHQISLLKQHLFMQVLVNFPA